MNDDVIAFLLAQFDKAEQLALAAQKFHPTPWRLDPEVETTMETGRWVVDANDEGVLVANGDAPAKFYAANSPSRVLADITAKRAIIAEFQRASREAAADPSDISARVAEFAFGLALEALALPYPGSPVERSEWRIAQAERMRESNWRQLYEGRWIPPEGPQTGHTNYEEKRK